MLTRLTFTTDANESGLRLDAALLARFPTSTRAFCRAAIGDGRVLVNGRPRLKGHKLRPGDAVTVEALKEACDNRVHPDPFVPVKVIFEDAHLIAADKPAGLPVHPLDCEERGTLMNGLVARYPELAALGDRPLMAGALHRIDTDTSGLVLAARTAEAFANLRAQFDAQSVEKTYLALVEGHVAVPGRLVHDLAHLPGLPYCKMGLGSSKVLKCGSSKVGRDDSSAHNFRTSELPNLRTSPRAFRAETAYRPLELAGPHTLLEVTIRTGVTHQIRCQLALAGWPVVNDTLYGARAVDGCARHFLHAFAARFAHPASGHPCRIETPLPADFLL
jgi:23S rRNA pseudouridine1911/1915/1917 synthase